MDTKDLVQLVKQFQSEHIRDEDLLTDIEEMVTYRIDEFKHEIDITEF